MLSQIKRWEARIDEMDTSKGVSNKMIQAAMQAEIKDLRAHIRELTRDIRRPVNRAKAAARKAQARTREWRSVATRYQKELAQLRTQLKEKP